MHQQEPLSPDNQYLHEAEHGVAPDDLQLAVSLQLDRAAQQQERSPAADPDDAATGEPSARQPVPAASSGAAGAGSPAPVAASTAQVTALLDVSSYLVGVLDFDELVTNLLSRVVAVLPSVQAGILWLQEQRPTRLRVASTYGLPLETASQTTLQRCVLTVGEGLVGASLQQGRPLLVDTRNGYRDTVERLSLANRGLFKQIEDQLPRQLTVVCVPLRAGNEQIGVIELLNLGEENGGPDWRSLRESDIPVLQTFGNLAAAAIQNAQLYTQTRNHRRRLDAFDAVVTAISTATDLNDLMHSVLDVVMELVPVTAGALLLLDRVQDRLTLGAQRGLPPELAERLRSLPVSNSPCEEVVYYGQPTLRPLLEERGEGELLQAGLLGSAYLPLLAGGTVAGVLALYGDVQLPRHVDMGMLMPLSNQVGFAIANVRLYDDSQVERRKLNTVINSIAEGVILCDSQGRLELANEAAITMLGLDSMPFQQQLDEMPEFYSIRDLDGQALPVNKLPMAQALAGEVFHDYRVLLRGSEDKDVVMSFSGAPARAADGTVEGAVVVFRDITANQKLERAKDEFLAVAAHELRSPLAAVRSYADLLLRREQQRSEADPRDLHGLTILSQQVSHMLRMVDNLLDVSRLDAGQLDLQLQRVNLGLLASQVLDQQRPAAANRNLQLDSDQDELWVRCDSLRIRQVLTNLIGNAIKYSPPESTITLRLKVVDPTRLTTDYGALAEYGEQSHEEDPTAACRVALVAISDAGSGVPQEQQTRLFQRFYRARSRRAEGLGLGLYLSRQFVLMHGGQIWFQSVEGEGSTFYFTLPIDKEP